MCKLNSGTAFAVVLLCATAVLASSRLTFTTLHSFDNTDGANPFAALVQATDGNFYGTTPSGGANGGGTVFTTTPSGKVTTLYSFCSQGSQSVPCTDGATPYAALVQAADGNFYGTTSNYGGAGQGGTVFKITPTGMLTTLYRFCSEPNCADGGGPSAALVQATDGNFYGTTPFGGDNNGGTVFQITPSGTLTTLYSFCSEPNCTDGALPFAALVQATDGNFYGTTPNYGGAGQGAAGGTVFKITPTGTLTTLYSFCSEPNCTDGARPLAALVQATDGNFYGTTLGGGVTTFFGGAAKISSGQVTGRVSPFGTVFKITPSGTLTTLYSFCSQSNCTDGAGPQAALVQATDGNFYGTTTFGGANQRPSGGGLGTAFKITQTGTLTTLYSFCSQTNCTDGANPFAALVQFTPRKFYGTTYGGGANGYGTIFRLSVGVH